MPAPRCRGAASPRRRPAARPVRGLRSPFGPSALPLRGACGPKLLAAAAAAAIRENPAWSFSDNAAKALRGLRRHLSRRDRQVMERDAARVRIGRQLRGTRLVFTFAVRPIVDDGSE